MDEPTTTHRFELLGGQYFRSDALFVIHQVDGLRKDALSRPLLDLGRSVAMVDFLLRRMSNLGTALQ